MDIGSCNRSMQNDMIGYPERVCRLSICKWSIFIEYTDLHKL